MVSPVSSVNSQPAQSPDTNGDVDTTIVQKDDTLSKIAERNGVSEEDLKAANPRVDFTKIQQGQGLTLPQKEVKKDDASVDAVAPQSGAPQKAELSMQGQVKAADLQGKMNAVDDAKVQEDAKYINDKLTYKIDDWAVTDQDVRDVHNKLETLPPAQYKAQIEQMKKDGLLDRYISNMGDREKSAFLAQAADKGYITGGIAKVPQGALDPPMGPQLYDNKTDLPKEMRGLISEKNLQAAAEYDKDYSKYQDRYCKALDDCKSPEEMRKLGACAPKLPLGQEPGYENNTHDEFANAWASERIDKTRDNKQAMELAAKKMFEFTGRRPAGDLFAEAEAGAKVEYKKPGGAFLGGSGKIGGTLGSESGADGKARVEALSGFERKGLKVTGSAGTDGNAKVEVKGGKDGLVGMSVKADGTVEVNANQAGLFKAKAADDGKTADGPKISYGPYGSYNPSQAEAHFGEQGSVSGDFKVKASGEKVRVEVSGKGGFGIRGVTPDEVKEGIVDGPGYWKDPAELQQGKSWNDLPAETRERYQKHYGWSEKEWQNKVPKYQPLP